MLAAACSLAALPTRSEDAPARIPATHGTALDGTAVVLPDVLKGKVGLVVLGFSHASQTQVMNWGRLITADYGKASGLAYYEIPMIGGAPKMLRGMIIKSMGKAVPADERPHFVPLVEDDKPWRAVAKYWKPDDAYLILVDGDGTVRWQVEGDATDAAYAGLKRKLNELLAAAGAH